MIKYMLLVPALKTAAENPLLSTCPCSSSTISRVITHIELLALASTVLPYRFLSPILLYPQVPPVLKSQPQLPAQEDSPEPITRTHAMAPGCRPRIPLPGRSPVSCWLTALQPNTQSIPYPRKRMAVLSSRMLLTHFQWGSACLRCFFFLFGINTFSL